MNSQVCILDYGSGNVRSVANILASLDVEFVVSNKSADIAGASHLILPGVGAFGAVMEKIRQKIDLKVLEKQTLKNKKPFLGICVGMQILAEKGYEFGEHDGLGWISGSVRKMNPKKLPLPHIGWNNVDVVKSSGLFHSLGEHPDFYFVHSFSFQTTKEEAVVAYTDYGGKFVSAVSKENIFGVQFHPEKSQKVGAVVLSNFLKIR